MIVNGTLAAAVGLGLRLWLAGAAIWLVGHLAAVWATRRLVAADEAERLALDFLPRETDTSVRTEWLQELQ